jgi:hypothetical protein
MGSASPVWPGWRFVVAVSAGWGLTWALGFQIVYELNSVAGWASIGAMGGLVSVLALRSFARLVPGRMVLVAGGWLAAGLCAASVTNYEIAKGWIAMGMVGGGTMAFAGVRSPRLPTAVLMAVAMVGWIAGGLGGVGSQATWGREVGAYIGIAIGGRAAPYVVWSLAWGIGGSVTGALGGGVMTWQAVLKLPPKLPAG